jgi:hypothetical protein
MSQAMAIVKSGRSFDEASQITGIPVNEIISHWQRMKA